MRFPKLREGSQYRVTIPALCGGVNLNDAPNLVEDDQLTDVKNMWWKDQALRTRPGLAMKSISKMPDGEQHDVFDLDVARRENSILPPTYGRIDLVGLKAGNEYVAHTDFIAYDGSVVYGDEYNTIIGTGQLTCNLIYTNGSVYIEKYAYYPQFILFTSNGKIFMDYQAKDESGLKDITEEAYAPLVMVNGVPSPGTTYTASGTAFEGYNMLTGAFRMNFTSNGEGKIYHLPQKNLTKNAGETMVVEYTHTDGKTYTWTIPYNAADSGTNAIDSKNIYVHVDRALGYFYFAYDMNTIYAMPESAVRNNVCVKAWKTDFEKPRRILGMTLSTWFGGDRSGTNGGTRLFLSGNSSDPGLVHWSDINNPLYFPENNYAYIGDKSSQVTAFGKQQNILVIFKENEMFYAEYVAGTPYTAEDVIDGRVVDVTAYAATFPITPINSHVGCGCPGTVQLCNNHLVWAAGDGHIYTLASPNSYNQRNVQAISQMVEPLFTAFSYDDWKKARAVNYRGHYLLQVADKAFLFNYGDSGFVNSSSYYKSDAAQRNIAWYVWDITVNGVEWLYIMARENQMVLLGHAGGYLVYYTLDDSRDFDEVNPRVEGYEILADQVKIPCVFQTKVFDFGSPDRNKFIRRLHLGAADTADGFMSLAYITEDGVQEDICRIGAYGDGKMREWAMTPGVNRVRQFGIRAESDGNMAVDNMVLKYEVNGEVR